MNDEQKLVLYRRFEEWLSKEIDNAVEAQKGANDFGDGYYTALVDALRGLKTIVGDDAR